MFVRALLFSLISFTLAGSNSPVSPTAPTIINPCATPPEPPDLGRRLFATSSRLEALEAQMTCQQTKIAEQAEALAAQQTQLFAQAEVIHALEAQLADHQDALLGLSMIELTLAEVTDVQGKDGLDGLAARVAVLEKGGGPELPRPRQVIYHFWATTCAPCVVELPEFVQRSKALDPKKVRVRFIAEENDNSKQTAKDMFIEKGGGGGLEIAPATGSPLRGRLNVSRTTQPLTVLVTPSGAVRMAKSGVMHDADWARLTACLDQPMEELKCR